MASLLEGVTTVYPKIGSNQFASIHYIIFVVWLLFGQSVFQNLNHL